MSPSGWAVVLLGTLGVCALSVALSLWLDGWYPWQRPKGGS